MRPLPTTRGRWAVATFLTASAGLVVGCQSDASRDGTPDVAEATVPPPPPWEYVETGDLSRVRARGFLRVATRTSPEVDFLPRGGIAYQNERELAALFAEELGIELAWIEAPTRTDMLAAVRDGRADVALGRLPLGTGADDGIAYSLPLRRADNVLLVRGDVERPTGPAEVPGPVAVQPGSFAYGAVAGWPERHDIDLVEIDDRVHPEELLYRLANGEFGSVATEREWAQVFASYNDALQPAFELDGSQLLAAAVRVGAEDLRKAIDSFLLTVLPQGGRRVTRTDDLEALEGRPLRLLTLNTSPSYYLVRGQVRGLEYELARSFARSVGARLEVVVAPSREDLIPWLLEGRGDIVASSPGPANRRGTIPARATVPYAMAPAQLVVVAGADVEEIADLGPGAVVARAFTAEAELAESLLRTGPAEAMILDETAAQLFARVSSGAAIGAIVQDLDALTERALQPELTAIDLDHPPRPRSMWVRRGNPQLGDALDAFLSDPGTLRRLDELGARYLDLEQVASAPPEEGAELSPFDPLVRTYSTRFSFDWRMITAQMWQESRFNPRARSPVGALGLMQIMPETGREMGFHDLTHPETSIHAGVRYLAWARDRFGEELAGADILAFSLASYNAGYGHVLDARRVAEARGWDPDRWFDNVERAMLLLSQPEVYRTTRYGYARGAEPVHYVQAILGRYREYVRVAPN